MRAPEKESQPIPPTQQLCGSALKKLRACLWAIHFLISYLRSIVLACRMVEGGPSISTPRASSPTGSARKADCHPVGTSTCPAWMGWELLREVKERRPDLSLMMVTLRGRRTPPSSDRTRCLPVLNRLLICLFGDDVADGGVDPPTIVVAFDTGERVAPCGILIGVFSADGTKANGTEIARRSPLSYANQR
jgi:hypothetical protein